MSKYQDTVETLITARNTAMQEMRKAEDEMRALRQREAQAQREQARAEREREQTAIQHLQKLSKIAVAAGAARLGISALNIGAQLLSGDFDSAAAAAERLPFGIGGAVREARELAQTLSGAREEMMRQERISAAMVRTEAMRHQQQEQARNNAMEHAKALLAIEREIAVLRADPSERAAMQFEFGNLQDLEAIEARIANIPILIAEAARKMRLDESVKADRQRMQELFLEQTQAEARLAAATGEGLHHATQRTVEQQRLKAIADEQRAIMNRLKAEELGIAQMRDQRERLEAQAEAIRERNAARVADRQREAAQAERDAAIEARAAEIKAEQERIRAVQQADETIEQLRLRQQGKVLEAEIRAIRTAAAERIAEANKAGNDELAIRERVLGWMQEREARFNDDRRQQIAELQNEMARVREEEQSLMQAIANARRSNQPAPIGQANQERFLTGVREQTQQQDRATRQHEQKSLKALQDQLNELKAHGTKLQEVVQALQNAAVLKVEEL